MNIARYLKMTALVAFAIARLFATITPAVGQTHDAARAISLQSAHTMGLMPEE